MNQSDCNTEKSYHRYKERLEAYILARIKHPEDAKDIVQETYLKFEMCVQKGHSCDHPKSYLFKMASNNVYDYFRKKNKEMQAALALNTNSIQNASENTISCDPLTCIQDFLSKVPHKNKVAYIKSDIENNPQTQVAKELNIPVSTLKSRVQKTRQILKEEFERCYQKL